MEDTPQTQVLEESRARRELAEFRSRYPQVSLSREDLLRLAPEMVGEQPKTLTEAYRCWQDAEKRVIRLMAEAGLTKLRR